MGLVTTVRQEIATGEPSVSRSKSPGFTTDQAKPHPTAVQAASLRAAPPEPNATLTSDGNARFDSADQHRINLDANANAAPTPAVVAAVLEALTHAANPSSAHAAGDDSRLMLERARDAVTGLCLGALPENIIFTSGCTEANNLVLNSARVAGATVLISAVEHASIMQPAWALRDAGHDVKVVPVHSDGTLDLVFLEAALDEITSPIVLSVQSANSETGVLQPIARIAELASKRANVVFHTDAAQSFGKEFTDLGAPNGPALVTVSGHKLHGPMGVGALLISEDEVRVAPILLGGDQERGLRAGTQAVPLIAGFGAACRERLTQLEPAIAKMTKLRDRLETAVLQKLPTVRINGAGARRLPNTSNMLFPGLDAMALVAVLDSEGVLASQGSACHSRRPEPSHVLVAMGLSEEEAFASVRFSVSPANNESDIETAASLIVEICGRLGMGK